MQQRDLPQWPDYSRDERTFWSYQELDYPCPAGYLTFALRMGCKQKYILLWSSFGHVQRLPSCVCFYDILFAFSRYATLDPEELGLHAAEELFDYEVFSENPKPFYKFASQHFFPQDDGGESKKVTPSFSHYFLAMLQQHSHLLRVYTQNIDGLEELAGGKSLKVCHLIRYFLWILLSFHLLFMKSNVPNKQYQTKTSYTLMDHCVGLNAWNVTSR